MQSENRCEYLRVCPETPHQEEGKQLALELHRQERRSLGIAGESMGEEMSRDMLTASDEGRGVKFELHCV